MPKRIQRKRTKGWRAPKGAIHVGRPSKWGNPWSMTTADPLFRVASNAYAVLYYREWLAGRMPLSDLAMDNGARRRWILSHLHELRGHDLVCWCGLGEACHASILLTLANAPAGQEAR